MGIDYDCLRLLRLRMNPSCTDYANRVTNRGSYWECLVQRCFAGLLAGSPAVDTEATVIDDCLVFDIARYPEHLRYIECILCTKRHTVIICTFRTISDGNDATSRPLISRKYRTRWHRVNHRHASEVNSEITVRKQST